MDARVWLKRMVAVFVILLLAYSITGYLGEYSKLRVIVNNTSDYYIDAYAKLNLSDYYFKTSGMFTIAPHSKQVMAAWLVAAGNHKILVAWGETNDRRVGPDAYFFSHSYYLMPFTTKNVVVEANLSA